MWILYISSLHSLRAWLLGPWRSLKSRGHQPLPPPKTRRAFQEIMSRQIWGKSGVCDVSQEDPICWSSDGFWRANFLEKQWCPNQGSLPLWQVTVLYSDEPHLSNALMDTCPSLLSFSGQYQNFWGWISEGFHCCVVHLWLAHFLSHRRCNNGYHHHHSQVPVLSSSLDLDLISLSLKILS